MKIASRVVAVATLIAAVVAAVFLVNWGALKPQETAAPEPQPTKTPELETTWYRFFNLDLQDNESEEDDWNFGPNPWDDTNMDAGYYDEIFRARMKEDPALAAADMSWMDANMGTRIMGAFYDEYDGHWDATMNAAKETFMKDQLAYYERLDLFFAFLDKANRIELRECKDISDQMYMNPITIDGIPDIIVYKTDDQTGYELVYVFVVKGHQIEVAYRINCGFQPTNVSKTMAITPSDKPGGKDPSPTTKPQDPTPTSKPEDPTPTTKPQDPTPSTTPVESPKDPNNAPTTNTEPNDNPGPGLDTNNGVGAQWSTEEQPTNSVHYPSYDDYRKDMDELADINANQQTPENNPTNKPSTSTPTGTTVDSNADKGTGNGGINDPTPVTTPATSADNNQSITNTPDNPAGAWGGPSD